MQRRAKRQRYFYSLMMIAAMVGMAELLGEKEIIFPEMAALTIGMWIIDKRVWRVSRLQLIVLMTWGAVFGVCLVRYSPLPLYINLGFAFLFAAVSLTLSRTTLIPLISACMLPVMLGTVSWVYPLAVLLMSGMVAAGQFCMEKKMLRQPLADVPANSSRTREFLRWTILLSSFMALAAFPVYASYLFCILPPLIVTYAEFANSKAGFRNRPVQIFLLLVISATLGTFFQAFIHHHLGWPETIVALCDFCCLFLLYELSGKYFAPAGAIALIPMIVPQEQLLWLPLQVAVGAFLLITTAMMLFLKCYRWPTAQLIVCLIPALIRPHRRRKSSFNVS